jgi:CubicO group peptidase (beta-lactamase class C family)
MPSVDGLVAAGFEPVRDAFVANFEQMTEVGAAVSVRRHGRPVVDLWGGIADPTTGRPWRPDTLQVVYSITKSATAACAHLLAQRGQLDFDTPVAHYWPEFAAAGKDRIPVRWLLSHQAGLPVLDDPLPPADVLSWDPVVRALAAQAPVWNPGTIHGYHAMTYGYLVGEVVRKVSGHTLGTFFAQEIAAPHGMDFWIGLPRTELSRVSHLIGQSASTSLPDPTSLLARSMGISAQVLDFNDPAVQTAELPATNGTCTARALAHFYAALLDKVDGTRILDESTLAMATAEQVNGMDLVLGAPTRFALGFGLPLPSMPWWSPTAFGNSGLGGSLGYADPATGIAFGYVMNRLDPDMSSDMRAANLVEAVRVSLRDVTRQTGSHT